MTDISDCPLCELRFHREQELIDHLRTDHRSERSERMADLLEKTARDRRRERRLRARGLVTPAR